MSSGGYLGLGARVAVWAALAAVAAQGLPPPRMFSPWYAESLRDVLELEEADVARIERQLAVNPEDIPLRLKLMAYHQRADRAGRPQDRAKRVQHTLWLIEHHSDSELLHSYVSRFSPGELTPAEYQRAITLWAAQPAAAAVQWNAASFFQALDAGRYLHHLEATAAADPNHPFALRPLADLYALSILEGGPLADRAQAGLEASKNVWVLGNAAYMLQSQYNRSLQMGAPNQQAAALAERYFLRAKALDPNLDRKVILPQLQPQSNQTRPPDFEKANRNIRRLPVEAFPELPAAVAGVLRARNCRVPQTSTEGAPRNVIRGEFFRKGESGWAVLCSANNSTSLLAFRNDRDSNPDSLTTSEDRNYLQTLGGNRIGYSHEITAVGGDVIMRHYRAYGGQEPPPIDHQGIDDAFLGKASVTRYFHKGKWWQLQGAD